MRTRSWLQGAAKALFLLTISVPLGMSAAWAQDEDGHKAGPVVNVNGDGSDITTGGANVTIRGPADRIKAFGAIVDIRSDSTDDVLGVGARLSVDGVVGRDLTAVGAVADVRGEVDGNAKVFGTSVTINADIAGDLMAGGAHVRVGDATRIGGSVKLGGANVRVGADIAGDAKLGGVTVVFSGSTGGSLSIAGEDITITGLARIDGDLTVYSRNEPNIASGAVIGGRVERIDPEERAGVPPWLSLIGMAVAVAVMTVLAGLVLLLFGGRVLGGSADAVRHSPVSSLLLGILTLAVIPLVAAILGATVVGVPVAIALLLIVPFLAIFGHASAATAIAGGIFLRRSPQMRAFSALIMLIFGAVILAAITLIPWFGVWLVLIASVTGLGAFTRTIAGRVRKPRLPPTTGEAAERAAARAAPQESEPEQVTEPADEEPVEAAPERADEQGETPAEDADSDKPSG